MKNIGEQVKAFREARGWSYTRMAEEVSKHHTEPVSRQLITQLEDAGDRTPRYVRALAVVMGTTADALLSGQEPALPPSNATPRHSVESSRADYTLDATTVSIHLLAKHLMSLNGAARDRAGTLMANLATDPSGPWADWLVSLLKREIKHASGTTLEPNENDLSQNGPLDLSTYPGLKEATEWRRELSDGNSDASDTPKKQSGGSA